MGLQERGLQSILWAGDREQLLPIKLQKVNLQPQNEWNMKWGTEWLWVLHFNFGLHKWIFFSAWMTWRHERGVSWLLWLSVNTWVCLFFSDYHSSCLLVMFCTGFDYVHDKCSPSIIHRDVKSTNILVSDKLVAKVADFGLFKIRKINQEGATHVTTAVRGTAGYLDPE